jgi:hypothetical protein
LGVDFLDTSFWVYDFLIDGIMFGLVFSLKKRNAGDPKYVDVSLLYSAYVVELPWA